MARTVVVVFVVARSRAHVRQGQPEVPNVHRLLARRGTACPSSVATVLLLLLDLATYAGRRYLVGDPVLQNLVVAAVLHVVQVEGAREPAAPPDQRQRASALGLRLSTSDCVEERHAARAAAPFRCATNR